MPARLMRTRENDEESGTEAGNAFYRSCMQKKGCRYSTLTAQAVTEIVGLDNLYARIFEVVNHCR